MKRKLSRKEFIANSLMLGAGSLFLPAFLLADKTVVMTRVLYSCLPFFWQIRPW
jgi:hypothetical protein